MNGPKGDTGQKGQKGDSGTGDGVSYSLPSTRVGAEKNTSKL